MAHASSKFADPDADAAHLIGTQLILIVPILALWFFNYAQLQTDVEVEQLLIAEAEQGNVNAIRAQEMLGNRSVSSIMTQPGPGFAEVKNLLGPVAFRYNVFKWMNLIAIGCLVAAILGLVPVGLCMLMAERSDQAFYRSLLFGWGTIRLLIPLQLLGQAILLGFLSFWMPAIFTGWASLKLTGVVSMIGIISLHQFIRGLFTRHKDDPLDARVLSDRQAPALWERVKMMADYLGTAPPDHIIVGVEANFFVTESPIDIDSNTLKGRTLYLSLPLLKQLSTDEADAILAHEMAHFCGGDTFHSARTVPLLRNFSTTLRSMENDFIVTKFMNAFWLFFLYRNKARSREREFRADAVAAKTVAPLSLVRSLVKVAAYAHWREQLERRLFSATTPDAQVDIQAQMETGFPSFLARFLAKPKIGIDMPHPFDSHPPMKQRATQSGLDLHVVMRDPALQQPPTSSWMTLIPNAGQIEEQYLTSLQNNLQSSHREQLAMQYYPKGKEEKAIVTEAFPERVFMKGSKHKATLTYLKIHLSSWKEPIYFEDIEGYALEPGIPSKVLRIQWDDSGKSKTKKCVPAEYKGTDLALAEAFEKYYARHLYARSLAENQQAA